MNQARRRALKALGAGAALSAASLPLVSVATAAGKKRLTMQLDWVFNAQFAGLIVADHLGQYDRAGLDVQLTQWSSGSLVTEATEADRFTLGCAEQNLVLAACAEGAPVKAVATMFQASPLALMSLPGAPVTSAEDLPGLAIGMHVDGLKVMDLIVAKTGIAPDAVSVTTVSHEEKFDALASGRFDAVQCYAVDEPIDFAKQTGIDPVVMPLGPLGHRAYAQVIFAHEALIAEQPDLVNTFLDVSFAGWRQALADPEAAARIIVEHYAEPGSKYADLDYQRRSLALVADFVTQGVSDDRIGVLDEKRWRETAALFVAHGIIPALPDIGTSIATELWPRA